jgi:hypothetical protein
MKKQRIRTRVLEQRSFFGFGDDYECNLFSSGIIGMGIIGIEYVALLLGVRQQTATDASSHPNCSRDWHQLRSE